MPSAQHKGFIALLFVCVYLFLHKIFNYACMYINNNNSYIAIYWPQTDPLQLGTALATDLVRVLIKVV